MEGRLFLAAAAVMLALPAPSLAATYTYKSRPMYLVPVPGGYWLHGMPVDLNEVTTYGISFWVDPSFLRDRLANTRIVASIEPGFGETTAVGYRGGVEIARQDGTGDFWFSISGPVDSFGAGFSVTLDAQSDVEGFGYWTDGESTSLSLGGASDSVYEGTASGYEPQAPEWISDGPGTWVHSPVPVPAPATAILLLSALGSCAVLRMRKGATGLVSA